MRRGGLPIALVVSSPTTSLHTGRTATALRLVPPHATTMTVPLTLVSPSPTSSVRPHMAPRPRVVLTYCATRTHTAVSAILTPTPSTHLTTPVRAYVRLYPLAPSPPVCASARICMLSLPPHELPHPHVASPSLPSPLRTVSPTLGRSRTLALPLILLRPLPLFAPPRPPWHSMPHCQPSPSPSPSRATSLQVLLLCRSPTPPSHKRTAAWPWASLPLVPSRSGMHAVVGVLSPIRRAPIFTCTVPSRM